MPNQLFQSIIEDFQELSKNYEEIFNHDPTFHQQFLMLYGLLRNVVGGNIIGRQRIPSVAVFGGTNVGKSTIINILLDEQIADSNVTASHTRNAQAFVPPRIDTDLILGKNPLSFLNFEQVDRRYPNQPLNQYIVQIRTSSSSHFANTLFWDAPDIDSKDFRDYLSAVMEVATLADLVLYVTSDEKYGDLAPLEAILPLFEAGIPIIGCFNKLPPHAPELVSSFKEHLNEHLRQMNIEYYLSDVVGIFQVKEPFEDLRWSETVASLRQKIQEQLLTNYGSRKAQQALRYIQNNVSLILKPANDELKAFNIWNKEIEGVLKNFTNDYQKNYLDDPERYDAFRGATLRLLDLLDIPAFSKFFQGVRWVFSFPALIALKIGGKVFRRSQSQKTKTPYELETLKKASDDLLNHLASVIESHREETGHHPFWDSLYKGWTQELDSLYNELETLLADHWKKVGEQIEYTAEAIFQELQRDPGTLFKIRSAVIASKAIPGVIAVLTAWEQTGATDFLTNLAHDAAIIPFLTFVIENLTIGATAAYVESRKQELQNNLKKEANRFVDEVYHTRLARVTARAIQQTGILRVSADRIISLPQRLQQLKIVGDGS